MPAAIDITGQRFGRLVALHRADGRKWAFRCDCGTVKAFIATNVKRGVSSSCGCLRKEAISQLKGDRNMVGKRFGQLSVVRLAGKGGDHGHRLQWECLCDCGATAVVGGKQLRSGNTKTCGHTQERGNLTGRVFSRLTVMGLDHHDKGTGGSRYWRCACSCGSEVVVGTSSLASGNTKSCGCLKTSTAVQNFRNEGIEAYRLNPEYANRRSWIYLAEVASVVDKVGIAFDVEARARTSDYSRIWWQRQLTRAQAWVVEQVVLKLTVEYIPSEPFHGLRGQNGPSEQRVGWSLDEVIEMIEELCLECERLGHEAFWAKFNAA
jgi:hypothetical protein